MAPCLDLPYDIRTVTPDEDKIIKKCLTGYTRSFVKCGKNEYVMPGVFRKHAHAIYNLQVRPDDVWVITFPRSGTTWTQELVWLVQNNLDFAAAKQKPLYERFPMLETTIQIPEIAFELIKANFMNLKNFQGLGHAVKTPSWKIIEDQTSPRFVKTHMPLSLLPPGLLKTAKVIYVARDPRDVAVSYFYLHKMVMKNLMRSNFVAFWEAFRRDLLPWAPIVAHTNEAWLKRHEPNLHFVFYEDLIKDLPKEIRKICKFLGKEYTDEQLDRLSAHLSFDSLRKTKTVNNSTGEKEDDIQFIRKGEAGGWKAHFTKEMEMQAEEFLLDRLRGLDLSYPSFPTRETTHL
ncbi:sulfotransferase 1E1 [Amyelois transitella]|uniref:sulfotransferase 1E1 n=1 Tax=Amyelois transitella TaxID=680683 RepID=UPI00067C2CC9|nr:sulfotransferase 1E1 [Amyelois transitella]